MTRTQTLTRRFTLTLTATVAALTLVLASGCAVTRGQETVGAYVDDTAITTAVKARFVEHKDVDAASITVETLNGTVMLAGFAKNATEAALADGDGNGLAGTRNHFDQEFEVGGDDALVALFLDEVASQRTLCHVFSRRQ